jgi:mono/diheme cytochrome c family protein
MAWLGGLIPAQHGGSVGAQTYQTQCAVCHGPDRAGAPPAFPPVVDVLSRLSVKQVTDTIKNGNGRMPSFPNIDGAKINALIEYLRTSSPNAKSDAAKELTSVPAQQMGSQPVADKAGEAVYAARCAFCHGDHMEGIAPASPMLIGVGSRLSKAQIAEMIHNGKGPMPPLPDLGRADLDALLRLLGAVDQPRAEASSGGETAEKYIFTGYRKFLDPDGYPAIAPPWGTLNAIDLKSGKYLWKIPLGEYPALAAKGLKNTGTENYGGPIVTAGGIVFIGAHLRPGIPRLRQPRWQAVVGDRTAILWGRHPGHLHGGWSPIRGHWGKRCA